jgi:D-glycero-D-manno-heptose 1,7-bisphosphate phosphatase
MLLQLAEKHNIDLAASAMIGDRDTDVEAGEAAGTRAFLFKGGSLDVLMVTVLASLEQKDMTA